MKGSEIVLNYVHSLYYKCHKINLDCGGSYIDFLDWRKYKKATMNSMNEKNNKCFQYAITCVKSWKIKPLKNEYNLEGINFPSRNTIGKMIEQLLGMLCVLKRTKIYPAFKIYAFKI